MSQADEVKKKLDIVELIREYIPIKAVGANFQALCPFHNEKSPSFVISPEKQIWHCFGCGKGGDVFSFVMERDGLEFPEALRFLADKAGVVLNYENKETYSKRNRLLDILEISTKYYEHCLKSESAKSIREYLYRRGLNDELIAKWRIGYSPDSWDALYNFLKARPLKGEKYKDEEIFAAGLIIKKETFSNSGRNYYDRFRDRIMFPIADLNSNIVAFTARVNPEKETDSKMGKYINSPQTELFDKSRLLFALDKAKQEIKKLDSAIVVEGQMDAISCHNHGLKNVVASSGTALTKEQIALLKRYSRRVALVFDMDAAGQLAADRGIRECLAEEMDVKIITLPSGKDPDESLRNNPDELGKSASLAAEKNKHDFDNFYKKPIENAKSVLEYNFEKLSEGLNLDLLENKKKVRDGMLEMISLIQDKTEQGFWLKKVSDDLGFLESDMREEFLKRYSKGNSYNSSLNSQNYQNKKISSPENKNLENKVKSREERLSELFLSILIKAPEFISYAINNIEAGSLLGENLPLFYNKLIIYYNKNGAFDYQEFKNFLDESLFPEEMMLRHLTLLSETEFYDSDTESIKSQLSEIIVDLKKYHRQRRLSEIQKDISLAEKSGDKNKSDELMAELKKIMDKN